MVSICIYVTYLYTNLVYGCNFNGALLCQSSQWEKAFETNNSVDNVKDAYMSMSHGSIPLINWMYKNMW